MKQQSIKQIQDNDALLAKLGIVDNLFGKPRRRQYKSVTRNSGGAAGQKHKVKRPQCSSGRWHLRKCNSVGW